MESVSLYNFVPYCISGNLSASNGNLFQMEDH